ncbi:hypothetical protein [Thalassobaculum sp.]|uniref:hypothetical protein n=1 Tax=Thalassobaculum sp. TaxID=2022740 RepID=UPI0032EEB524
MKMLQSRWTIVFLVSASIAAILVGSHSEYQTLCWYLNSKIWEIQNGGFVNLNNEQFHFNENVIINKNQSDNIEYISIMPSFYPSSTPPMFYCGNQISDSTEFSIVKPTRLLSGVEMEQRIARRYERHHNHSLESLGLDVYRVEVTNGVESVVAIGNINDARFFFYGRNTSDGLYSVYGQWDDKFEVRFHLLPMDSFGPYPRDKISEYAINNWRDVSSNIYRLIESARTNVNAGVNGHEFRWNSGDSALN